MSADMWTAVLGLYFAVSLLTFAAYAIDKSAARHHRWRTRETTLHLFSLAGGWPGAWLAQRTLRHKSSKRAFKSIYRMTILINCVFLGGMLYYFS